MVFIVFIFGWVAMMLFVGSSWVSLAVPTFLAVIIMFVENRFNTPKLTALNDWIDKRVAKGLSGYWEGWSLPNA